MPATSFSSLLDLFKRPNRAESEIFGIVSPNYDREFIFYSFLVHFFVYILLILPPTNSFVGDILPYLLGITIARLVLLIQAYNKAIKFNLFIFLCGFIADGLLYLTIGSSMLKLPTLENFYLSNAYLMACSLLITLYSFRLQRFTCLVPALYFTIFHIVFILSLPSAITLQTTIFARLMPVLTFFGAGFLGSIFILNKRKNISDLYRLSEERRFMQQELELAKKVQDALFPNNVIIPGLTYKYYRKNPNLIGGDFFDFVQLREGNVGVFLTDVAGHGISSALVASIMKVLVSTIPYRLKLAPSKLLGYLDERLTKDLNKYHASAIYLFFDFLEKKLTIGNAGHPYIIHCPKGKDFYEIETEGSILGFSIRNPISDDKTIQIASGDRFVVYTDGIIESITSAGEELGAEGFLQILTKFKHLTNFADLELAILSELKSGFGIDSFSDDTMILLLEVE